MPTQSNPSTPADRLVRAILHAVDPNRLLHERLTLEEDTLSAGSHRIPLHPESRIFLVAIGKAAPGLSQAAADILGTRLTNGVCTLPPGISAILPEAIEAIPAGHPLPNGGSLRAGERAAAMLAECRPEDRLLALISGGGSAMFESPVNGVSLEDLQNLTDKLLRAGAQVSEINRVRKALSTVKAGGLARLASPASTLALILSDVVGDSLADVASGPTVPQPPKPNVARGVLERYALWKASGPGIQQALLQARRRRPSMYRPINLLLGDNRLALAAAVAQLESDGLQPKVLNNAMRGEASELGREFGEAMMAAEPGTALLQGGEATVRVQGNGRGGPNTEFALAAAFELAGRPGVHLVTFATDGSDGSTDAAGAVVDGRSTDRMRAAGIDPAKSLAENDSYTALDAIDGLLRTGPTGTNVNDLVIGIVDQSSGASADVEH